MSGRARGLPLALALAACTSPFLPEEPPAAPEAVFEAFWADFDAHYSFFREKGVDWDSVYEVHRPRISSGTADRELFGVLVEMVEGLEDGHITLYSPFRQWAYEGWYRRYPQNYEPQLVGRRLRDGATALPAGGMRIGWLSDRVGYLRISSFEGAGFSEPMDQALEALRGAEALVLDVRSNGGGSDLNSDAVLARFADRERVYAYAYYRNGPAHDDFTAPRPKTVRPGGRVRFAGPVAVLTNRGTFSTAEDFVLAMRALPHAAIVGDTTGGGSGNPYWRELPNGWSFRLSRWRMEGADGLFYEGVGIPPDVPVWITESDRAAGVDTMLEAAITLLLERLPPG